jgi:hypothetical protein
MDSVHGVNIKKSLHTYIDKAVIKLPASARLQSRGDWVSDTVDTAKHFKQGDKVIIELGYNEELIQEFEGFVSKVNFKTPCEIECEGYSWQLRENKSGLIKSWKSTTLKEVLQYITAGTDIILSNQIPVVNIAPMYIKNCNAVEVLDWIKENKCLAVYFIGKTLYAGLEQATQLDKVVKYRLGYNTIKDDDLKYRKADEVKVRVRASYLDSEGKRQTKEFGDKGGLIKSFTYGRYDNMQQLEQKALADAKEFRYEGYEGKITTFLVPFFQPGFKASLEDVDYQEKGGDYIGEAVETKFEMQGARRIIEIGKRLNVQK